MDYELLALRKGRYLKDERSLRGRGVKGQPNAVSFSINDVILIV